jgi:hypothetical protein
MVPAHGNRRSDRATVSHTSDAMCGGRTAVLHRIAGRRLTGLRHDDLDTRGHPTTARYRAALQDEPAWPAVAT